MKDKIIYRNRNRNIIYTALMVCTYMHLYVNLGLDVSAACVDVCVHAWLRLYRTALHTRVRLRACYLSFSSSVSLSFSLTLFSFSLIVYEEREGIESRGARGGKNEQGQVVRGKQTNVWKSGSTGSVCRHRASRRTS